MVFHKEDGSEVPDCFYCKYFDHKRWICYKGEPERLESPARTCLVFERKESHKEKEEAKNG